MPSQHLQSVAHLQHFSWQFSKTARFLQPLVKPPRSLILLLHFLLLHLFLHLGNGGMVTGSVVVVVVVVVVEVVVVVVVVTINLK